MPESIGNMEQPDTHHSPAGNQHSHHHPESNTSEKISELSGSQDFALLGMTCLSCAASAEKTLCATPGVSAARVYFNSRQARIAFNPRKVPFETLQARMKDLGYTLLADPAQHRAAQARFERKLLIKLAVAAAVGLPMLALHLAGWHHPWLPYIELAVTIPVVIFSGGQFFVSAWQQLRQRSLTMDTLVAIGTGAALALAIATLGRGGAMHTAAAAFSENAAVILMFILAGKWLEEKAKTLSSERMTSMAELTTGTVEVLQNGQWIRLAANELAAGDLVRVHPGQVVPADGILQTADALLDESTLTGETLPALKQPNDNVMAGTTNSGPAVLELKVTAAGPTTVVATLLAQVQETMACKVKAQALADRIAAIVVPGVLVAALVCLLAWGLLRPDLGWMHAATISLSLVVISCPCALGLATPVALKLAVSRASAQGLLVRDAALLEVFPKINTLVLDKTGTLTEGKPVVHAAEWDAAAAGSFGFNASVALKVAGQSQHPLSRALATYLAGYSQPDDKELDFVADVPGKGMQAMTRGNVQVHIGRPNWLKEMKITFPEQLEAKAGEWQEQAYSTTAIAINRQVVCVLALTDALKTEAAGLISGLMAEGIQPVLLSGDNPAVVARVASELGIKEYAGGMTPADKAQRIDQLKQQGHITAMAGDGINDTLALARADASLAMGTGASLAMAAAQGTLLRGNLLLIPYTKRLAASMQAIIRQNLFWAFAYNVVALPFAAGVFYPYTLEPMYASAAMAFSSLFVVLNSMRLLRK